MDKRPGSGIFPDPDPGDPKRLDPTGSGSATLIKTKQDTIKKGKPCQSLDYAKSYYFIFGP